MKEHIDKLIDFVNPRNLKNNLIGSSLYIAIFETTKDYIVEQVRDLFSIGYCSDTGSIIDPEYKQKVLSKDPKSELKSSLLWFCEQGAISQSEVESFDDLRKYRNELAHEMLKNLYNGLGSTFSENFNQLISLRIKLERWWIFNVEIPTSDVDPESVKDEDVMTSSQILYKLVFDVLSDDDEKSKYYYSEFLKYKEGSK